MWKRKKIVHFFILMAFVLGACEQQTFHSETNAARQTKLAEKAVPEFAEINPLLMADTSSLQPFPDNTPESKKPMNVPLINQMDHPRIYNGCEVSSLAMILNYHGYNTTKNKVADKLPRVPLTYDNGQKGNPNEGFVGDMVNGPGLSVYHGPMYDVAQDFAGNNAIDLTGKPIDMLYQLVAQGLPAWVITTVNFAPANDFETWDTPSGEVDVTFSVHSVVVTGFDKDYVYINNPYGQKNQKVNKEDFEAAWEQMGSQAIVITK